MGSRIYSIGLIITLSVFSFCVYAQEQGQQPEPYREGALRRFEIVSLTSLPFTSIYSYGAVRLFEMARQGKVSPKLSTANWRTIQVGAVTMALTIGFVDWLRTRNVDRSEQRITAPGPPELPETDEDEITVSLLKIYF